MISRRAMMNDKIVSAVGTSLTLENVKGSKIPSFTIKGWTKQITTTGAQLFNQLAVTENVYVSDADGEIKTAENTGRDLNASDYIDVSGLEQIFITKTNLSEWAAFYNSDKVFISGFSGYGKVIAVPEEAGFMRCTITKESMNNFMVNAGATAQPWEPYSGGLPSPSPNYPQEVVSAGLYDDTEKYNLNLKVTGKNLFAKTGYRPQCEVELGINTPVTFSADGAWDDDIVEINFVDTTTEYLQLKKSGGRFSQNYTAKKAVQSVMYRGTVAEPQIEYGLAATKYEPYKCQSIVLNSDRPLTKWDRLEKRDGVWGWVYKSKQFVLNGNETVYDDWVPSMVVNINNKDDYVVSDESHYCTHFSEVNTSNTMGSGISVRVDNYPDLQTAENFKAFLTKEAEQENPVIIWAETIKENFVPLSDTEQSALNALHTYTPTTVITNDQQCEMQITYREWRR